MSSFKALLVEGTSGVGKSTLIDALVRKYVNSAEQRKIRTILHLTQGHTYGPLAHAEDDGTLTITDNLAHLDRIVGMLEWLEKSVRDDHEKPWCFVILDTLHLTHCVRPGVAGWKDVETIDVRLATIDCKLLLVQANEDTIWSRGIASRSGTEFLDRYALKFGRTHEEIHRYFLNEQKELGRLF
ncbi:MAG TPA: hypothetical protein VFC63_25555 [Blastocatellia bacterium]|nr:hypothetical protein [Blastocatellia bacterium]